MRAIAWLFLMLSVVSLGQETQTFRASTNLVNLAFSVRDSSGRLVENLAKEDLEVLEDAIPQKIAFFSRSVDLPLTLGLIVDFSDSQQHFYKQHSRDLEVFLKDVLGPKDRAFLICFGNHLRLASDFSQSGTELLERLKKFDQGGRNFPEIGPPEERDLGTAFYDSIYYSVTEKLAQENGRRALLMFSDGEDNSSSHDMMSAIEAAQAANVPIFAIRYTEMNHGKLTARNQYGIRVMDRIAKETGGRHFDAKAIDSHTYFREVADELRTSYELGYYPSRPIKDDTFRKIVIRPRRDNLIVRAKTGYFSR
ncbi:MAG TPA: VWA domain-containing protein [Candidatus Angelobacter sp.]|jgi:Ca-activated chloride channel family protein|nr:VWA domain-containing protein [Candidatus Angelobacter sp.]